MYIAVLLNVKAGCVHNLTVVLYWGNEVKTVRKKQDIRKR